MSDGPALFAAPRPRKRPRAVVPAAADAPAPPAAAPPPATPPTGDDGEGEGATFKELGLSEWLCRITASLGITRPTPVQRGCIPAVLAGRDVVGVAQTGSGKTAAFALPLLQRLAADPHGVHTLCLTPTRELAFQLADQFVALGAGASVRVETVVGGLDAHAHARALAARPHVVVATPGRLAALIGEHDDVRAAFGRTAALVLDEADRLLAPSFGGELATIARALPSSAAGRQTLLFSATLTPSVATMRGDILRDAFTFQAYEGLQTAAGLDEEYVLVPAKVKDVYLAHLVADVGGEEGAAAAAATAAARNKAKPKTAPPAPPSSPPPPRSAIVFCDTTRGCASLAATLAQLGLRCAALHSGLPQRARLAALASFRGGRVPLLLATDVGSRGLDIPSVDLVVNYDVPCAPEDYVHRVGRTARAGRAGRAVTLVTQYDVALVQAIEARIGHALTEATALDEGDVLRGVSRVFKARRAAALDAADAATVAAARGGARRGK